MLKNKVVLILGGTGNLGQEVSVRLEKAGATVCVHGTTAGEYQADATNSQQLKSLIKKVIDNHRRLDVIVNTISAPLKAAPLEEKEWTDFLGQLNVQLKAAFETAKYALPFFKQQKKGKIINIITAGLLGQPISGLSDYLTAKHAVWGLTKSLAKELAKYNVTVNAVSPNYLINSFTKQLPGKMADLIEANTPLGRLASAADVAKAVIFLAGDDSDYITGENIFVTGGNIMR